MFWQMLDCQRDTLHSKVRGYHEHILLGLWQFSPRKYRSWHNDIIDPIKRLHILFFYLSLNRRVDCQLPNKTFLITSLIITTDLPGWAAAADGGGAEEDRWGEAEDQEGAGEKAARGAESHLGQEQRSPQDFLHPLSQLFSSVGYVLDRYTHTHL